MWIQSSIEIHKLIESVIVSLSVRRRLRRRVSHIEMSILVYHRRLAGSKLQNIINSHLTFDVIHLSLCVDATKAAKTILTIFTLKLKTIRGEGGINQQHPFSLLGDAFSAAAQDPFGRSFITFGHLWAFLLIMPHFFGTFLLLLFLPKLSETHAQCFKIIQKVFTTQLGQVKVR